MAQQRLIGRREFLRRAAGATAWLAGSGTLFNSPATAAPAAFSRSTAPDLVLALTASPSETQILPGRPTAVWRFTARVLKGDGASLLPSPGAYLGPTLRLK